MTLYVKVFECLNLKFLPRRNEYQRAAVACSVYHSNNRDRVYIVLPVLVLLLPASVSYHFCSSFTSHGTSLIKV